MKQTFFRLFFCILFFSLVLNNSRAQTNNTLPYQFSDYLINKDIDSLEQFALSQKKHPNIYLHALIVLELSSIHNPEKFGKHLDEIKLIAQRQSSEFGKAMYESLAVNIYWVNDLEKATQACLKALDYFERQGDVPGMIDCYYKLIAINLNPNSQTNASTEQAIIYYNKSLTALKQTNHIPTKILGAKLIINFTNLLFKTADISRELSAYDEVKTLIKQNPQYESAQVLFTNNMGVLMTRIGRDEDALQYYYQFLRYPNLPCANIANMHSMISSILIKLKKNKDALRHIEKGMQLYEKCNLEKSNMYVNLCRGLSFIYYEQKEYEKAWKYRDLGDSVKTIIEENIKAKESLEIQSKYENDKKEFENKNLQLLNKQQKIVLQSTILVIVLLLVVLYFVYKLYMGNKKKNLVLEQLNGKINAQNEVLNKTNQQLEYFVYSLSHDALGYINHILNFCTIGRQADDLAQSLKTIDMVHNKAKNLKNMSQSLIKYHRLNQNTEIQEIRLNKLVEEVVDEIGIFKIDKSILLDIDELPIVQSDTELLKQVFRNLLSNCIKYRKPEEPLLINIFAEKSGEKFLINIKDNGIGIDDEIKPIIFEKFVRGKGLAEGSGLGLNICRQVIQNMGGEISLSSKVGEGSTFSFTLPFS